MTSRLLLILLSGIAALAGAAPTERPPNIILIMADDLGIECLGSYGGTTYDTPFLDRMAAEGLRFTHAYSQPLCAPTRVQLMTGKYNHRNWEAFGIMDPESKTFGHLMQGAGYRTCIAGKWQLFSYDPPDYPGADKRRGQGLRAEHAGFDSYQLFHALETEDKGSRYANPTHLRNGELETIDGAYGENLNLTFVVDFLKAHRDEPLFIYYPMVLPHWPMVPTPLSEIWSDPERRLEEDIAYFPDMVRYMDQTVGRLMKHLKALDLDQNTLVLFYADNGTDKRILSEMGDELVSGGKGDPTQTGIRVPLIAHWPGKIQPGVCHDLIDASDFFPTLAELANAAIPAKWGVEGHSFAPALFGKDPAPREWCYFWYDPRPGWDKDAFDRHIFALDHQFKLFSDDRLFAIDGERFKEELVTVETPESKAAHLKLKTVLSDLMTPPLSRAALTDPDEFGKPD